MALTLLVAVDIGATKTLVTVRSADELAAGWQVAGAVARSDSHPDPEALVDRVAEEVGLVVAGTGANVAAVGVAAPGPVDSATGVITRSSNLGWEDVPIGTCSAGGSEPRSRSKTMPTARHSGNGTSAPVPAPIPWAM